MIAGEKYKIKAILTGTINNQFQDIASYVSDSYFTIISTPKESTNNDVVNQPAYLKSVYVKMVKLYRCRLHSDVCHYRRTKES